MMGEMMLKLRLWDMVRNGYITKEVIDGEPHYEMTEKGLIYLRYNR